MRTPNYTEELEDDAEAIVTYLELINDFIRANIQEEMNEYLGVKAQVEEGPNSLINNQSESPNNLLDISPNDDSSPELDQVRSDRDSVRVEGFNYQEEENINP